MATYELLQQGASVYIPVLLLSLAITVVAYGAFPLIFAKARKSIITKRKYKFLCYGVNFLVNFLFIIINEKSSGVPYLLWTWIFSSKGTRILRDKYLLAIYPTDESKETTVSSRTEAIAQSESMITTAEKLSDKNSTQQQGVPEPEPIPVPATTTASLHETPIIRFCRKCGFELLEGSEFCSKCGTRIVRR